MKKWFVLPFTLLIGTFLLGQDSLQLSFKQLGLEDIEIAVDEESQQVFSGSRSLRAVKDIPFNIYIVSKEEIQRYGYVTLTDVLRSVPGIRASLSGSGLDGETFLMRGLFGNTYTKILVNDLPIRPSGARSMPLAAQLPIQQAERIEITFGPSMGIYGADALGGVINIITAETERPFFVQADAALGIDNYSNLSVLLGGKVGRDENIVKFSILGGHTDFDNRRVIYEGAKLFAPSTYNETDDYLSINNYRGDEETFLTRNLPHRSEFIGFSLSFRSWRFNFEQLERDDHSSIGQNPTAVAYSNPATLTGERITRFTGSWFKEFGENLSARTDFTWLDYDLDNQSSNSFILNTLNRGILQWKDQDLPAPQNTYPFDELANRSYQRNLAGIRYSYAQSTDIFIDPLITYAPLDWLELAVGANIQLSDNEPYLNYSFIPYQGNESARMLNQMLGIPVLNVEPDLVSFTNTGLYFQQYATFQQLNIVSAVRYDIHSRFQNNWTARIAGIYEVGPSFSIRASIANAKQYPSTYYEGTSLSVHTTADSSWFTLAVPLEERNWEPETNFTYEIGVRGGKANTFQSELTYFRSRITNLLFYDNQISIGDPLIFTEGYFQDANTETIIRGWQGRIRISPGENTSGFINFLRTVGEEKLPFDKGEIETVRGMPKWLWQLRFTTKLLKNWFIQYTFTRSQEWTSRSLNDAALLDDDNTRSNYMTPSYGILDLTIRYQLNKDFQAYLTGFNVFNERHAGINFNTSPDLLRYNPQSLRTFRLGLSYRMR